MDVHHSLMDRMVLVIVEEQYIIPNKRHLHSFVVLFQSIIKNKFFTIISLEIYSHCDVEHATNEGKLMLGEAGDRVV